MAIAITKQTHQQDHGRSRSMQSRSAGLADDARLALAARCENSADLRELALMLGLLEVGPGDRSLVKVDPWDVDPDGPDSRSPKR